MKEVKKTGKKEKEGREEVRRQQGPPSRRGARERPRPGQERTLGLRRDLQDRRRRRALKGGHNQTLRTSKVEEGRPGVLGAGGRQKVPALRSAPWRASLGRTPGSSGPLPGGRGYICALTNERASRRPRPPGAAASQSAGSQAWGPASAASAVVSSRPPGSPPASHSSPCSGAPRRRPRRRGVTQRGQGSDSLGLAIRADQGLECRDEWGERVSSELVPEQCWGLGPSRGGGERARPRGHCRAREVTAALPCLGQGHGGGRVLSF